MLPHLHTEHHDASRLQLNVLSEVYLMTGEDVGSFLSGANNLGITLHRHSGSLGCAVYHGHNSLVAEGASHNVYTLDGYKLGLLALDNDVVALAPV